MHVGSLIITYLGDATLNKEEVKCLSLKLI